MINFVIRKNFESLLKILIKLGLPSNKDFQTNKKAFAQLVKNGDIPEGANPYYFNKMMSLDLNQKARKFKLEFDDFTINFNFLFKKSNWFL